MLEGCWTLATTLSVGNERDGYSKVRTWRQCFDGRGRGRQTAVLEDGRWCEGPLAAGFDQAGVLRVTEPEACTGPALRVGRSQRLVTPAIRAALDTRDQSCVFPGCDKPPRDCHAHHRTPWWAGGVTALTNLHLFCDHHHGTIEPSRDPTADPHHRWQVRLRPDGVTELIPPRRVDPLQRPRTHARFHHRE